MWRTARRTVALRSAIAAVRDSAHLPVALLRWELGDTFPVDALALPAMLALRESPLLLSAWAEVSSLPAPDDATPVPEPDTPRKEPEETPQPSLPDAPQDDADNGAAADTDFTSMRDNCRALVLSGETTAAEAARAIHSTID